jgi:hypothetical protein
MGDESEKPVVREYRVAATEALRLAGMPIAGDLVSDDEVAEYCVDNFPRVKADPRQPLVALMGLVRGLAVQLKTSEEKLLEHGSEAAKQAEHNRQVAARKQREKDIAAMRPAERMMLGVLEEMRDLFRKQYDPPKPANTLGEAMARTEEQLERERRDQKGGQ